MGSCAQMCRIDCMLHIHNLQNLYTGYLSMKRLEDSGFLYNFSRGPRVLQLSTMKCLRWHLALLSVEWRQVKVLPEA